MSHTKEASIKTEVDGEWIELRTSEVQFEEHKDMKFAIAPVTDYGTLAVVMRYG